MTEIPETIEGLRHLVNDYRRSAYAFIAEEAKLNFLKRVADDGKCHIPGPPEDHDCPYPEHWPDWWKAHVARQESRR